MPPLLKPVNIQTNESAHSLSELLSRGEIDALIGSRQPEALGHDPDVARLLSPLVGLDAPTLEVALKRTAYGVQPVTVETLAYQQRIADTFNELKLIPKKLTVSDARWNTA